MKKQILFSTLLSLLFLVGCEKKTTTVKPTDEISPKATDTVTVAPSTTEVTTSSAKTTTDTTTAAPTTSSEPEKTTLVINGAVTPEPNKGTYPGDGVFSLGTSSFAYHDIMKNTGKYKPKETIQMKKATGYIQSTTSISADLSISIYGNVFTNKNGTTDGTVLPTVYGFKTAPEVGEFSSGVVLTPSDLSPAVQNGQVSTATYLDSKSYSYFAIVNESRYAQYLDSITFTF